MEKQGEKVVDSPDELRHAFKAHYGDERGRTADANRAFDEFAAGWFAALEHASKKADASSERLGLCVSVNGAVVAWFAYSDNAEDWASDKYFGRWTLWRAAPPVPIPLTDEELDDCERRGRELHAKIRVE